MTHQNTSCKKVPTAFNHGTLQQGSRLSLSQTCHQVEKNTTLSMAVDLGNPTQFPNAILHVLDSISVGILRDTKKTNPKSPHRWRKQLWWWRHIKILIALAIGDRIQLPGWVKMASRDSKLRGQNLPSQPMLCLDTSNLVHPI